MSFLYSPLLALALAVLLYLVLIIAGVVTDPHRERHLRQIAPMTAGLDIQATTRLVLRLRDA